MRTTLMQLDIFCDEEDLVGAQSTGPLADQQVPIKTLEPNIDGRDANSFTDLGVNPNIVKSLLAHKITTPTEIQQMAIPRLLQGGGCDAAVVSPTASGKTLTFLIPIISDLQQDPIFYHSLIITPTRELAYQINEQFSIYLAAFGLYSNLFIGGGDQLYDNNMMAQGCYVLICTPGRLLSCLQSRPKQEMVDNFKNLKYLVLDEADQFLGGSADFNNDFTQILDYLPPKERRRTILTTASLSVEMKALLEGSRFMLIKTEQVIPINLKFSYVLIPQDFYKSCFLIFLVNKIWGSGDLNCEDPQRPIGNPNFSSMLIFVASGLDCEVLNRLLIKYKFQSCCLHGQLTMQQRIQNLSAFKSGRCKVLVSTDIASRGLDIQGVDYIINYSMPRSVEDYQHRAGRCMRNAHGDRLGQVINLVQTDEFLIQRKIREQLGITITKLERIWDYNANKFEPIVEETIIREYFGRVARSEKQFHLDMIDQDVGQRIKNKAKSKELRRQGQE